MDHWGHKFNGFKGVCVCVCVCVVFERVCGCVSVEMCRCMFSMFIFFRLT